MRPDISRDFVYVDNVSAAFLQTALQIKETEYGDSFNIGTGRKVTMADIAGVAQNLFDVTDAPQFTMTSRHWDVAEWYAQPEKARESLKWSPLVSLEDGLRQTAAWMSTLSDLTAYEQSSRKYQLDTRRSVSAIIACYKDGQAIPIMYRRLKETFQKLNVDHEIIFVNDCSPDDRDRAARCG